MSDSNYNHTPTPPMSREEFNVHLCNHTKWLRAYNPDEDSKLRMQLSGANLSNLVLEKVNLTNAILAGANLSYVSLHQADLQGADLTDANLGGATLDYANLRNAYLTDANLYDCSLHAAVFDDTEGIIDGGQRIDGYRFLGQIKNRTELWIKAGCRYFPIAQARAHWHHTRPDSYLGKETQIRLDMIEAIFNLGSPKEYPA